jgi:pyruvate dehydrogenase E1 component alpha subunit
LCFLGDGALDQGSFHEAMNLAALWDLPVIYIVENNGYSMGTSIERHAANEDRITARAEAYGIETIDFDGFNVLNVYDNLKPFADKLREEQRPGFVNLRTYRYQGHSMSDPQKYRTKDEVDAYKENDPIASLASHLMASESDGGRGCLSEGDWDSMQKEVKKEVMDAIKLAESQDDVPLDELHTDVYALPMPRLSPTGEYRHGTKNPLL